MGYFTRATPDQSSGNFDLPRRRERVVQAFHNQAGGLFPELGGVVRDDRDARGISELEIVEADEGDGVEPVSEGSDHTGACPVISRDYRGRWLGKGQQITNGVLGARAIDLLEPFPLHGVGDASLAQRMTVSTQAFLVGIQRGRTADEGDAAMTGADQLPYGIRGTFEIG